ncbi:PhzF family phenazine biosynthesis protein [Rhodanobacter sp. MP7CTX1]|uniref:PhzF family phenazine biosynthesis protein n=1 Tax=Rhodanobacter sp. MP7CTX1 TaxID=2723084 RepID=UPI00160D9AB6|nr:PhzF family phenazine biosynthesis protein [Rhodanobacter sp. MP7CTX1]MBB6187728.1 trans-2,3-dihydro-3-hydroxyanthranilate isomerase [Rhodanobacter sp. MP7CTX1]
MPSRRYVVADVFTQHPHGGNQLAVVLDSEGLTTAQMLAITREFNFAETTFVLPPDDRAHTARVRIFTTAGEVPFAGHPNVGTAFVLARMGEVFGRRIGDTALFEELAGIVPVSIQREQGVVKGATLTAPEPLRLGETFEVAAIAACLRLDPADVLLDRHAPREASVGLPFVMVELTDVEALGRIRLDADASCTLLEKHPARGMYVYARVASATNARLRARTFCPLLGAAEDAATGSANAALAGLLASLDPATDGQFHFEVTQGVEMGRPSQLKLTAQKAGGVITAQVGGACVSLMHGVLDVD